MNLSDQETQPAEPEYRTISLTRGQVAIVDAKHYERLSIPKWQAFWNNTSKSFYACRTVQVKNKASVVWMHREIMNAVSGLDVDHRNRNTLDNREENLRIATRSQNCQNKKIRVDNRSGFKGVTFEANSRGKKHFQARIQVGGKRIRIGRYLTAEEAYDAYCEAAKHHFGEFARLK